MFYHLNFFILYYSSQERNNDLGSEFSQLMTYFSTYGKTNSPVPSYSLRIEVRSQGTSTIKMHLPLLKQCLAPSCKRC